MDTCDQIFNPSLNQQRYNFVIKLINETESKVVTDVGCSECSFIEKVKFLCPKVHEINGLDIDKSTLEFNLHKTKPLLCDGLFPRAERLETKVYKGSIEQFDYRIGRCDLLSAIEVIEHLYPEQLPNFSATIFGRIKPKVVVITTPNKEFNVIFKNGLHSTKFRHHDHKFEWTRSQFEYYCNSVASKYNYTYDISGVGSATNKRKFIHVGFCTQIATFTRSHDDSLNNNQPELFNYQLLSWEYFYSNDEQANLELTMRIELIENLLLSNNNNQAPPYHCIVCNNGCINCAQFFNTNYTTLRDHFPYVQLFIDFIRYHTLSQITNNNCQDDNKSSNYCFIFRKKPTPIIISTNGNDEDEENESSSSSYFDDNSLSPPMMDPYYTTTIINNSNDDADEYWD